MRPKGTVPLADVRNVVRRAARARTPHSRAHEHTRANTPAGRHADAVRAQCVAPGATDHEIHISTFSGKDYRLVAPSAEEMRDWVKHIASAVYRLDLMEKARVASERQVGVDMATSLLALADDLADALGFLTTSASASVTATTSASASTTAAATRGGSGGSSGSSTTSAPAR